MESAEIPGLGPTHTKLGDCECLDFTENFLTDAKYAKVRVRDHREKLQSWPGDGGGDQYTGRQCGESL